MTTINSINELNLHDSELIGIEIKMDVVILHLNYINDYKTMDCSFKDLVFLQCQEVLVKINPGYCPPESILAGSEICVNNVKKYIVEMNTSASIIQIVAEIIKWG